MKRIRFSKNWNEKLCCSVFSTIRLSSDDFQVLREYEVSVQMSTGEVAAQCVLLHKSTMLLKDIQDEIFWTDMGMSKKKGIEELRKIYAPLGINVDEREFDILVFGNGAWGAVVR